MMDDGVSCWGVAVSHSRALMMRRKKVGQYHHHVRQMNVVMWKKWQ